MNGREEGVAGGKHFAVLMIAEENIGPLTREAINVSLPDTVPDWTASL